MMGIAELIAFGLSVAASFTVGLWLGRGDWEREKRENYLLRHELYLHGGDPDDQPWGDHLPMAPRTKKK